MRIKYKPKNSEIFVRIKRWPKRWQDKAENSVKLCEALLSMYL